MVVKNKTSVSKSKTSLNVGKFRYWVQQPVTWGLVLGSGFLLWQFLETLKLQSRVDKNTNKLRAIIEDLGQVSDPSGPTYDHSKVEKRLQSVQAKVELQPDLNDILSELKQSRDALAAAQVKSTDIVHREYLTQELKKKNDEVLKVVRRLFAQQSAAIALLRSEVLSLRGTALWQPLTRVATAVGVYATLIKEGNDSGSEWDATWNQLGKAITEYSNSAKTRLQQIEPMKVETESSRIKRLLKSTARAIITSILGPEPSKAIEDFNKEVDRQWLQQVGDSSAPGSRQLVSLLVTAAGITVSVALFIWWNWSFKKKS